MHTIQRGGNDTNISVNTYKESCGSEMTTVVLTWTCDDVLVMDEMSTSPRYSACNAVVPMRPMTRSKMHCINPIHLDSVVRRTVTKIKITWVFACMVRTSECRNFMLDGPTSQVLLNNSIPYTRKCTCLAPTSETIFFAYWLWWPLININGFHIRTVYI